MSAHEADAFMRSFLAKFASRHASAPRLTTCRYATVAQFQHFCIRRCEQQGFVETILSRRRTYAKINSSNASGMHVLCRADVRGSMQNAAMRSGRPSTL